MIAVDAMGGDYAPRAIVLGALQAAKDGVPVMLFGPQEQLSLILKDIDSNWFNYPISIYNSDQCVGMAEDPSSVVRNKKDSSLVRAVESVKKGICSSIVSAGNTGAVMVSATLILGRQEGVDRPAIIGILPVKGKRVLCLDLGANADCKPEYLYQFAQMGSFYAQKLLNISFPKVALLSNGQEEGKGNMLVKAAYKLLKESSLNFVGNVEPYGIFLNQTDVVVCDGFSGNVLLKTLESCMHAYCTEDFLGKQSGALLIGVNGKVVVVHGSADAQTMKNAILFAFETSQKEENFYGIHKKSVDRLVA